jgi:YVTN family beta-propeller protein
MSADASLVYVSDALANSVTPIEMAARRLLSPISAGRHPGPCALDPSGDLLLVANEDSNDVAVIRVRTQSLITMIPVGSRPSSLAIKLF